MKTKNNLTMKIAVLIGIVILPLIYSITYLKGFWDPYNNLGDIKVAVVNEDNCKNNCKSENLIDKLEDSDSFDFVVTDAEKAEDGLHSKDYYAIITIPSDFTSSFENAENEDRASTVITYRPNNKTNYIASQLINNAIIQVEMQLDKEVSKEVVSKLTDKLDSVPDQLSNLSNGLEAIANGTTLIDNGVNKLNSGTNELNSKYVLFDDGVKKLNDGLDQAKAGTSELSSNSKKIKDGVATLDGALDEFKSGTQALEDNYTQFNTQIGNLKAGANALKDNVSGSDGLSEKVAGIYSSSSALNTNINNYQNGANTAYDDAASIFSYINNYCNNNTVTDSDLIEACNVASNYTDTTKISGLKDDLGNIAQSSGYLTTSVGSFATSDSLSSLVTGINNLSNGADSLNGFSNQINSGIQNLNGKTSLLKANVSNLNTSYVLFDNGVSKLNGASNQLISGANTLKDSSSQIRSGISTLDSSVNKLKSGTSSLDSGVKEAKKQVDDKIDDTDKQLSSLNGLDEYTANPVEVEEDAYGEVNDYGTFFSPFFMSLSLWLGGILILIGLYYDPENRFEILGRNSKNRPLRLVYYVLIGIVQAIVLGVVLKLSLGFEVTNWLLFFSSCILISLSFLSIMMFLVFNFGDVGKFIAIVLLVIQLAACGGTFPLEVEPHFFKDISPLMPMTYSVELLRESFVSIEHSLLYKDVMVLLGILIVFGGLVFITGYIKTKKQELEQNKKSSSKIRTIKKKLAK